MNWSKFAVLALLVCLIFIPAVFSAHFGYTVHGVPQGGLRSDGGNILLDSLSYLMSALTFSVDGMPAAMGIYFILIILMMIGVIISFFGSVSTAGAIVLGVLALATLITSLSGLVKC